MALEDKDLFMIIYEKFSDKPIEFIMEQYEKAKRINIEIEKRLLHDVDAIPQDAPEEVQTEATDAVVEQPKKQYTRRNLKIKPQNAITEDFIYCCICKEPRQTLTAKHMNTHGITIEEYKKICGYASNQPLMSLKQLEKSRKIISRAQKTRLEKKAAENKYNDI